MPRLQGQPPPILVTGSHRSGSTWVGHVLAASRDVAYIHEPFNLAYHRPGICRARFRYWMTYLNDATGSSYELAFSDMLDFRYHYGMAFRGAGSLRDVLRIARDASRTTHFRIAHRRPLIKDPIAIFSTPWLHRRFAAQPVVLIRHPAAFVNSISRLGWRFPFGDLMAQEELMDQLLSPYRSEVEQAAKSPFTDVIDEAALLWVLIHHAIATYRRNYPSWTFIRHEDLSLNPVEGFRALFRQLNLLFTDQVLRRVRTTSDDSNPAARSDTSPHATRIASRTNAYGWRKHLDRTTINRIRRLVEPQAGAFYSDDEW